jgi:hypothetical protein
MAEYTLSLTAQEIDNKLQHAILYTEQTLTEEQQNQAKANLGIPDESNSQAIIDVVSLPNMDINDKALYRLVTADVVYYRKIADRLYTCECVDGLPESGQPVTDAEMRTMYLYYNIQDNLVYGYADDMLAAYFGVPVGWYDINLLASVAGVDYGGVITSLDQDPFDGAMRVLLTHSLYSYKDYWICLTAVPDWEQNNPLSKNYIHNKPFGYDGALYRITWDGDERGKATLDLSLLGYPEGYKMVRVDDLPTMNTDEYSGLFRDGYYYFSDNEQHYFINSVDWDFAPGVCILGEDDESQIAALVYDSDLLNAAFGFEENYLINGVYLFTTGTYWISKLSSYADIKRIPKIFLPELYYDDIIGSPDLSDIVVDAYTKAETDAKLAEIDDKINAAITGAIGGSY